MDDLIKLCDELEECKRKRSCYSDEIVCTKARLVTYVNGDENKVLKLKAQVKMQNAYTTNEIGLISLVIAILSLVVMIVSGVQGDGAGGGVLFGIGSLLFVLALVSLFLWARKKYGHREKWIKYIEVVLEEKEKYILEKRKENL